MYKITLNGEQVGQAQVEREGLYYKITCICSFPDNEIHKIFVGDGESVVKLGVCVPNGNQFTLSTRVPIKYLPGDDLYFTIASNCPSDIPISSGKPFAYLDKLETARLQITNGQPSIIID